ncbi:aminotransferase-like domain-containing protein [Pseudothauera rhizosphaerae]|uniref:PLP-dependent aminotransferase family protein n=1 Tax=Pseudothauera rhizosphaerae TaxID=2565932 RepID=A0A4S4AWB1_9RHOO|nr:PLP-dependent aminotransferase family protein [Pseudothauera rhizosphaerae]THF63525.1 PLP-dependent aminotransferase family protein [Pseudothauera rhizosphaerae]
MRVNKYIDAVTIATEAVGDGRPRYRVIAEALAQGILNGRIDAGSKLPPLRILADELSVTVGTINRAYTEIERQGLVTSRVGDGTYVLSPGERANEGEFENAPGGRPGVIDLSRNTHIPGEESALLGEALARLGGDRRRLAQLGEYLPDSGLSRHREAGAQWLGLSGREVAVDQVIVTNGAQHALLCAMMATLRKDDLIVSEHLTYPGLVAAARALGMRLSGLAIDAQGLLPEALEEACSQQRVHALYCTPTIHNPTTGTMDSQRRQAIADICLRHNLRIIEDDAHGVLVERHPPSLTQFAPTHTITISSLSKAVSAGLRVGFVAAPRSLIGRIASAVRTSCWMATPLAAEVGSGWILDGTAAALCEHQRTEIRRRKALVAAILASLEVRTDEDSYHYWIALPEPWRASELVSQLEERGVLVKAAEAFAVGRIGVPQCIRASISGADDEGLIQGIGQLVETIQEGPYRAID